MTASARDSGVPKAAFIDRDGVLNEDREFVYRIEDFVFIHGAIEALQQLQAAGYRLVLVTNQSGIARGLYCEEDYHRLTAQVRQQLLSHGVQLASVEYCPHLPDAQVARYRIDCDCRKPRPGMIQQALERLHLDPSASILVGDRLSDIQAGRAAGIGQCFLVRSGKPLTEADISLADGVYTDLADCVMHLLLPAI